ncbi:site-specific DNA-methyltransferase [Palleronia abyssalis]|uniref:site-specific DNA-methyltransferase (adenine-specific) n=1 Tax=Palleronia abyssalis TaxID=1501240 RepID=A0A2R8BY36_9RHOB|nr:DNA methyltransferase [Palleronia abyssalis]SPJ25042.1 Modification methylase RsrI [Palleronia abyssalis]
MAEIISMRIDALTPWSGNARTHSRKQIAQIAASIETFGFTNPVLVDEAGRILAGHGRVAAARQLGRGEVPCLRLDHMSADQKRAYVIADNRLAENAGWDRETLAIELGALAEADLDFDIGVIGFDAGEIDLLIEEVSPSEPCVPEDEALPPLDAQPVTRSGDLWQLGPHRLICGDARESDVVDGLMAGQTARMIFTDPPYNVRVDGHVCGSGRIRHREFAMASGEMSPAAFRDFLEAVFARLVAASTDGSIHYVCMDWRHMAEILEAGERHYSELKNLIVWAKDTGGMGSFYRSRHELIFAFKAGTAPHLNTFGLGQGGRYRTNVWQYRGAHSGGASQEELALHPTVKPVAMIADALRDCSCRGDVVLDAFGGSGSTLIAAHRTGRRARLVEIDPIYCDRTIRRWQKAAKDDARHVESGETFDARAERLLQAPRQTEEA